MRRRTTYWLLPVIMFAQLQATPLHAQVSNKPGSVTQVPGPSASVKALAPGSYVTAGQSPLVNYIKERRGCDGANL